MAAIFIDVNKPGSGKAMVGRLCMLVYVYFTLADVVKAADDNFTISRDDACTQNLTLTPAHGLHPFPPELLQAPNRSSFSLDIKACSDAHLLLFAIDLKDQPQAKIIHIELGKKGRSESTIYVGEEDTGKHDSRENPLRCQEFETFGVSWQKGVVDVFTWENGTWSERAASENGTWREFLKYPSTEAANLTVQSVFLAYRFGLEGASSDNINQSEWRLRVPCSESAERQSDGHCQGQSDTSSMVSQGHLAGAVVVCLVIGIVTGAVCVIYLPKLLAYIRGGNCLQRKRKDDAHTQEELEELSPPVNKTQSPSPPAPTPTPSIPADSKVDLALPGDNPPPAPAPSTPRKASNTYTPYHQMGAASTTSPTTKKDDVTTTTTTDVTGSEVSRKQSNAGRAMSPLPALPGDDVGAAAAANTSPQAPEEVYVNADAHIYEGMRHEAPIYENRNTGVYEALQPSAEDKK